jgi:hypothetical protein
VRDERHADVGAHPVLAMTFTDGLQQFAKKVEKMPGAVFVASVVELRDSIKFGSARTGAPAMPVAIPKYFKAGALRDSVIATYPDENTALIYTTKWYAPDVEFNAKNHAFASGGPHGWSLSHAAFPRIVEANAKRIAGHSGG